MSESIIDIKNLQVVYNKGKSNEVRSLDDISVKIYPEEYVIIFGPSGCGKSTLLYTIAGLQAPTSGEVIIEDRNLANLRKKEMVELHQTGVGLIFQAFYLISTLTVLDNVCLPKVFRGEDRAQRKEDGFKLLQRFGISEQSDKFPSQLSGGQKQRVAIARALVNNPQIILADEPVGNLDSESAENVLQILKELNEVDKKTVIMVTHNPEHLHFADRILHMKDGKVVSEEINRDKRPKEVVKEEIAKEPEIISNELKLLMRTFKNFSPQQAGALLIPYKAKQLISYIISELTEEQLSTAENFLKELLFNNIDVDSFEKNLDMDFSEGGANWNKLRAKSFVIRVREMLNQSENISDMESKNPELSLADYLVYRFGLKINAEMKSRLVSFLKLRLENKVDLFGLQERLDAPFTIGGVGLYKGTAEKIVKEIEMIMLLKYSA